MATLKRLSPAPPGLVAAPDPGLHPARLKIIAYCLVSKKKKKNTLETVIIIVKKLGLRREFLFCVLAILNNSVTEWQR